MKSNSDLRLEFIDHMRRCDCGPEDPAEIIDDDKRRRYRLSGAKQRVRDGSYQLKVDDGFGVGWCLNFKESVTHAWHSKTDKRWSAVDRAIHKTRADEAKRQREAEAEMLEIETASKAARLWARAAPGTTEYLTRKGVPLNGARVWRDLVVVPLRRGTDLVGLQFVAPDGSKRFLRNTPKEGAYFAIAKKGDDLGMIIICEGFATGGSIREATGVPVIVAFDAGNLAPVAKVIREKYPDAKIVIAGDNDQWTVKPSGEPCNPGLEKAAQAAAGIGGARVIYPEIDREDPARRTDWNDVAQTDGMAVVRRAFLIEPVRDEPPEDWGRDDGDEGPIGMGPEPPDALSLIRPLGHNRATYYFFPRAAGQIVGLSATAMSRMQSLYMLAPRDFWLANYGGEKTPDSHICAYASAHLIHACHQAGIFQPESTRGVGAWREGGRVVVNCGDTIRDGAARTHPALFRGEAVYESGPAVINLDAPALANKEAVRLRDVCRMLQWRRPQYADLLAGWLVVAPVGSALRWRPHIWVTGRSGVGKSTVIDEIVKPVLGDVAIKRDGGTSEAGVRKSLGASGRPYVLDEAESETPAQRGEMEKIVYLARRASSGGVVENANATYQARSCFCFSAINPRVEQVADQGRITQLELMPDMRADRDGRFAALIGAVHEMLQGEFAERLLARTVANMAALLQNAETFSAAAASIFGNKRAGDQIGPMLAGAYLLTSAREITPDAARAWMLAQDWQWHAASNNESDASRLVAHVMTSRVRYDVHGVSRESGLGELIGYAADAGHTQNDAAARALRSYGLRVEGQDVLVANQSPPLRKLLADTPWVPWQRTLSDYPGAGNAKGKAYFLAGATTKVTTIPLAAVLGDHMTAEDIPLEDEGAGGFF